MAIRTYTEVARNRGLTGITARRYIKYMSDRWSESEDTKVRSGYAGEWAERFKNMREYDYSDSTGLAFLKSMDALKDY